MNISLTSQLRELVLKKVSSGRYNSASEVVREALRLLEERDNLKELRLQTLKSDIAVGLKQSESGDVLEGDVVFNEIRKRNTTVS